MSDWIYDYDDNEPLYQMDDDYALGSDGHIVQNAGDNWGFEPSTGEFHVTSGWNSSGDDSDDDADSSYEWNYNASDHVKAGASKPSGGNAYKSGSNYASDYNSQPAKKAHQGSMDTGEAIVWTIISLLIAALIAGCIGGEHAGAIGAVLWPIVVIVIAVIKSGA